MGIYNNSLMENDFQGLTDVQKDNESVNKQYLGIMILFNDAVKKDKVLLILDDMIVSKVCYEDNKCFLVLNCSFDIYEYIKYKCTPIIKDGGISLGISSVTEEIEDMYRIFSEAEISVYNKFITSKNNINIYRKINLAEIEKFIRLLSKSIDDKDYDRIIEIIKTIPESFLSRNLNLEDVVLFWNQIVALIINKTKKEFKSNELGFMNYKGLIHKYTNLSELCQYLISFFSALDNSINNKVIDNTNENFKKLIEFVNQHYNEELHLKELANKFFINSTYCCELFRKVTGITYSEYVTTLRMEKACKILNKNKYLPISEVGRLVGYNDYYYFNRIFKKVYGITPLAYRKEETRKRL